MGTPEGPFEAARRWLTRRSGESAAASYTPAARPTRPADSVLSRRRPGPADGAIPRSPARLVSEESVTAKRKKGARRPASRKTGESPRDSASRSRVQDLRDRAGRAASQELRDRASRAGDRASEATAAARTFARRARDQSVEQLKAFGSQARSSVNQARASATKAREQVANAREEVRKLPLDPHLCLVMGPRRPIPPVIMSDSVRVATYNVHRWQGANGRAKPDVARAGYVISEMGADVVALQEVLRPFDEAGPTADDELGQLCEELDLYLVFAATRRHRRGQLGNAILSRFPITGVSVLDISYSRIERRGALFAQVGCAGANLGIVATHLSLVDGTRHRQVQSLMEHPALNSGPAVLMGDMNAWRNCKGSQVLEETLGLHHNHDWPASFPSGRPILSLDRIYTRKTEVLAVSEHDTPAARKASDHLPVVADLGFKNGTGA